MEKRKLTLDGQYTYRCSFYKDIRKAECAQSGDACQYCKQWDTIHSVRKSVISSDRTTGETTLQGL